MRYSEEADEEAAELDGDRTTEHQVKGKGRVSLLPLQNGGWDSPRLYTEST